MPSPKVEKTCPDLSQFKRLVSTQLSDGEKEVLLHHLEGCDSCAHKLNTLPEQDTLVGLIRQADTFGDEASGKIIARLIERLSKLRPGEAPAADEKTLPPTPETALAAPLTFACPACGKALKVKGELAGKKGKCPHCKEALRVPGAARGSSSSLPASLSNVSAPLQANTVNRAQVTGSYQPPRADDENKQHYDFLAPAQAPDELGRLGPYRVLQVLGAGGMGVVFRAEDPQLVRQVALKAMLPALAASDSARQRFLREARAAAGIKHDHIVSIYQVGEDRGVPFLAMEFLEGEPLDVRLQREGKLAVAEVLRIGREIALGLAAAHKRELIHRDIKPANIWLEGEPPPSGGGVGAPAASATGGRVKILDFGLARAAGEENQLTQQGAIIGTPAYMAPEQAQGKSLDGRCDLFSLGCVLYRLATGEPAFRGTDMISTLMAVATENPRPPHALDATLPPALSELIMALLAKEPEERPPSAQAVAETLEGIAAGAASRAAPQPAKARLGKADLQAVRRRRWGMALASVMMLGFGGWLLAPIVFKTKVRTVEGEALVVLEIEQPGAEVFVDGEKMSVTVPGDNKPVEIQVEPGQHKLRISKDGFVAVSRDIELKTGKSEAIRVRLEPVMKKTVNGEAVVVLEIEQPGAEVFIDGEKISVTVPGDNKPVEIRVEPGQHRLRISKDGFVAVSRDIELKTGKSDAIRVRLEPLAKAVQEVPATVPADALRRADIPQAVLASIGGGDPLRAPAELVAVLGEGRFRVTAGWRYPAFSPDGTLLAVPNGGEAWLFDASSGQLLRRLRAQHPSVVSVAFSPNGAVLAVGDALIVRLWDPRSGVLLHELSGHTRGWIVDVAFTPDSKTILSCGGDNTVRAWDVATGRQAQVLSCKSLATNSAVTPNGRLVVAADLTGRIYGWSLDKGEEQFVVTHGEVGRHLGIFVSVSADGKWLASGTNDKLKVWKIDDLAKKDAVPFFEKQTPACWLQFEKKSNKLWTAERSGVPHRACCWDPASGQLVSSVTVRGPESPLMHYALSPDSRTLAAFAESDRVVQLYDTQTGKPRSPDPGHTREVYSVAFSSDGRWLASGSADNTVRVWDLATGTPRHKLEGHTALVWSVVFSPDGKLLASGSNDGTIALWDSVTGARVRTLNGFAPWTQVRFSRDGKFLAACTSDGGVRMWSTRNGEEARKLQGLHQGVVRCLAFSADGQRLATGGEDGKLVITDLASGKVVLSLPKRNTGVFVVDFGADGETVAAGYCRPEPVVRVWDLKDKDFVSLDAHSGHMTNVSLRSDGRLAVTSSEDGSVRLWEIGGNLPRKMVLGLGAVAGSLSPDGRYVATGNSNGTIYLFRLPGPAENIGEWLAARGTPPRGLSQEAWLERVKGLYVGNVADAVTDRFRELNPGLVRPVSPVIEDGVVTEFHWDIWGNVKDLSPLQALPGLRTVGFVNGTLPDLSALKGIKLTTLVFWYMKVSDLSPLKDMPLRSLYFHGMLVPDLSPLKDMKLTTLVCKATPMTDAGLIPLQEMSSLRELHIGSPKITDAGLEHLKKLTDLEILYYTGSTWGVEQTSKMTGAGLVHLKGMTKLHTLQLSDTEVTDAELAHFEGLLGLRVLNLQKTRVTDAGLEHLAGLKNLTTLTLNGTAVTDKGVAKLKAALPNCNITR